jgi:predicted transcriptional regulator
MKPADVVRAKKLLEAGELTATEIANLLRVGRATMFRELRRARELEELGA